MGELLSFSGITTKVRAMQKYLISDADFGRMRQLDTVPEAVAFLRQYPPYESILKDIPEERLHRAVIEDQLSLSEYRDFVRLYQFAGVEQKRFLNLYFEHFEIAVLKRCLRFAAAGERPIQGEMAAAGLTPQEVQGLTMPGGLADKTVQTEQFQSSLTQVADFFARYSKLDLQKLLYADSLADFVEATAGSQYYDILHLLYEQGDRRLIDYESAIDMRYFRNMWEKNSRDLPKADREIMEQTLGSRIDMLNLSWIYRSKKYYTMAEAEIFALLIPIRHKLKKEEIREMVTAADLDGFWQLVRRSYYGRVSGKLLGDTVSMERWLTEVLEKIYRSSYQKQPYSIACLNTYFFLREQEIKRIINTIEEIRYGVNKTIYEKGGGVR